METWRRLARVAGWSLAFLAASAPAHATPAKARAILTRYVEVTGGRAALEADSVLHVKGRVHEAGLKGTFERWTTSPDRLLEVHALGTTRFRVGADSTGAWRTDLTSKQISPIEGPDLAALRDAVWFDTEQWACDTTIRAVVAHSAFLGDRILESVEVTLPTGAHKVLWFDKRTGLLARVTHERDGHQYNEDFSGWRTLAGRKRATVSFMGDSIFSNSFRRVIIDSVWTRAPKQEGAYSRPASALAPVTWMKAKGVARLPFRYRGGHVWVRASVNGSAPGDFILDTGCTMTALDVSWARRAGFDLEGEVDVRGVGGTSEGGLVQVHRLAVTGGTDGVEVRGLKALAVELQEDLSSEEWHRAAGLLGYDFLSRFVVELDFDAEVVTLHDPATYQHAGPGQAVPMKLYHNIPTVEVTLNRTCQGTFIVDVGNATVMQVHSKQVEDCDLLAKRNENEVQHWVGGIGGAFPETVTRLDSLRIGPFSWAEPVAGLTMVRRGLSGSHDIQGNLGTSVLERFRCTFDYSRGQLWLEPGARFAARDRFTRSGLHVTRWSGVVSVVGVVRRSPAEVAGLKARDIVRAVNGRPIERWKQEELQRLLDDGPVGETVTLTYERDLIDHTVEITLADVL